MFNIFKRKAGNNVEISVDLALKVFNLMPIEYEYVLHQLRDGIVLKIKEDHPGFLNYVKFSPDVKLLNQYENKKGPCFVIKGIKIFDVETDNFVDVYFYIVYGILLGYSTPRVKRIKPDTQRIDISKYFVQFFVTDEYEQVSQFLGKEELSLLNPNDVYEVKLKDKMYYHIKDLEDGDFVGIDRDGKVYMITLDPFEIEEQSMSLAELLT